MSLLFNMLCRNVIAVLPRSSVFYCHDCSYQMKWFWTQENKIRHCFHFPSIYFPWAMGWGAMIFVLWMLNFKPVFSFSSSTLIKRLFSSSSLSAIKVVSPAYVRLLMFLPAILIPPGDSLSLAFCMMHSVCKLNKQGDNQKVGQRSKQTFLQRRHTDG